jgi:hypothetical protein
VSTAIKREILVRWEIWRSFASCLRSYASAEGLNDPDTPKVDAIGDHIDVRWHRVYLGFTMHPPDGTAVWLLEWGPQSRMWGSFELLPEGAFGFEEGKKDLDHAAIDFLAMLKTQIAKCREAAGAATEVIQ